MKPQAPIVHRCMVCRTVDEHGDGRRLPEALYLAAFAAGILRPSDGICSDVCKAEYKARFCAPRPL